jgi:hypothetical protein
MISRLEHLAATSLVALILSTGASQLSAQAIRRAPFETEATARPLQYADFAIPQSPAAARHKSPFLAWFLSFLVPGAGQGYNDQWGKAAAFFGGAVAGVVIANHEECNSFGPCTGAGFWLLVASSVGSQIDAPVSAAAINKAAKTTFAQETKWAHSHDP